MVWPGLRRAVGVSGILLCLTGAAAAAGVQQPAPWNANDILGSKHDLTSLNQRAGVEAMAGMAFNDYENPCIYCHVPAEESTDEAETGGAIAGWNRIRPVAKQYEVYNSPSLQGMAKRPSDISMLCLSCHDGTVAVDRIVFKPIGWSSDKQTTLHMQLGASSNIQQCGKCHDGDVAHDISVKTIGTSLRDDHPISIRYAGFAIDNPNFRTVDGPGGFDNGVRLYDGMVECASCHDIHNPQAKMLLRVEAPTLCATCHIK
ncbi:MAG: cytochrome c3 family protein [Gammaproteobacteria bacterium]|nr:cytochrome c3 family protein [Gammaproteobacteria bacterium]